MFVEGMDEYNDTINDLVEKEKIAVTRLQTGERLLVVTFPNNVVFPNNTYVHHIFAPGRAPNVDAKELIFKLSKLGEKDKFEKIITLLKWYKKERGGFYVVGNVNERFRF